MIIVLRGLGFREFRHSCSQYYNAVGLAKILFTCKIQDPSEVI